VQEPRLTLPIITHNILRFRDVSVCYGRARALSHITTDIPCGGLVAIVGPNGAGKSTLLRTILGWQQLASGEVRIGDAHPHHALPRLAYLPQRQSIDWDFPITVREVVAQGRYPAKRFYQRLDHEDRTRIDRAMEELGLSSLAARQIRELSGGQQQRVFLARALAQGADIFLLDEPFAGLDLFATEELTHILLNWRAQARTVLAVVHDIELARRHFDHGLLLATELIAAGPIQAVLSPEHIAQAYRHAHCAHADPRDPLKMSRTTEFPQ
jgi:ABC-type Mn2+/Zn2+ transport system ATPase subunit